MNGGGRNVWISDGLCDDINNNELCQFDGGDCCGVNVIRKFCSHCECLGNFIEKSRNQCSSHWMASDKKLST